MSDSRAAAAEREEEIEEVCKQLKVGDTFYVGKYVSYSGLRPNTEYTLQAKTPGGWALSYDNGQMTCLQGEKLVGELVFYSMRRRGRPGLVDMVQEICNNRERAERNAATKRREEDKKDQLKEEDAEEPQHTADEMKLKPVTSAQLREICGLFEITDADESPGPLYDEAMELLLHAKLAAVGLKLVETPPDVSRYETPIVLSGDHTHEMPLENFNEDLEKYFRWPKEKG